MIRTIAAAALLGLLSSAAGATTVTSNTFDGICNVRVTLYGSPAPGGQVVLYRGAVNRGGMSLQVYPNQGNRVCYRRAIDPHNCQAPLGPEVCAPVTGNPSDTLDIR